MSEPKINHGPSISRRLTVFSVIFVTASVMIASIILYLIVAGVVREQIDQRLDTQIEGLRSALSIDEAGRVTLNAALDGPPFDRRGSGWYWQIRGEGVAITSRSLAGQSLDNPPSPFNWGKMMEHGPRPGVNAELHGQDLYLRSIQTMVGAKLIEITATAPRFALVAPARSALLWLIPAMTLLGASLVAGIFLQVRYGLRPLRQLTADISSISAGTLERLPDADVQELRPASREINRLVEQNSERLTETRLHFANLAHGLKTPVTSLYLALNDTNDPDNTMRALVDRIDQRIRHHLARARKTAAGGVAATTPVRPRVDDILEIMTHIYADRGVVATVEVDDTLRVQVGPEDLDEIIGNITDNAFKWAKGRVRISARQTGRDILLTISDDGPGIDNALVAEVFEPGRRMDETVPGDGFGLTIVKELVELHGGRISMERNGDGGLTCLLTLPSAI
ncbi:sensor histidine kinase [Agrobacterium fabrum]|uniref:sensor histidine kinase n=1 Tax=Agrobacterium fabrum TaxID=1176649 RepID=UPI001573CEC8|nr:HAMP domain-containing sensor histidine kinase [Agrobacterium fabrum]MCR6726931.1 HAMP domain-containing histidine kinase [Agrobacterium fabrum]MDH6296489.1 signal transduction histidine kinase [Agrobacterium fabrum]WIE29103.1 HAMP domain-containing sensor histidine kinase [Agrobacterium fabrum]WIE45063.1 HAMP domain-containing sensor histidine kinase [Agrobacterium fabrum]